MKFNWILLFSGAWIFLLIGCTNEQENPLLVEYSHSKADIAGRHLVNIQQVKKWIDENHPMVVFEISKKEKYATGHLPNAINLWRPDYENKVDYEYGGMMATKKQMEALLSKNGVASDAKIVLYDTKGCVDAMRFRWILTLYGYDNIAVMNGGKTAWVKAAYALTAESIPPITPTNFSFPIAKNLPQVATFKDVQAAIKDTNIIILDTREIEEYSGQPYISKGKLYPYKKGAFTHGCIPTAIHLNWSDAVDLHGDHCIKSLKNLHYNMKMADISSDKEVITYCQSGVRSAHTTYILTELLGFTKVTNYDGSWIEWSYYHEQGKGVDIEQHTLKSEFDSLFNNLQKQLN
jgi:thiosulfate/3-mercaptopyruvate sulfurtransferase